MRRPSRRSVSQTVYARIDAETERAREAEAVKAKRAYTPFPADPPLGEAESDGRDPIEMARAAQAALRGGL